MSRDSHPQRRATSADIARAAGVSRATVSYVLNDAPGKRVGDDTRKRVLDAARALGHYPSAAARSLRSGRSNVVLALVRDFTLGHVASKIMARLDQELAAHGYVVLAHHYDGDLRPLPELWGLISPALIVAMSGMTVPDTEEMAASPAKFMQIQGIVPHAEIGRIQARYLYERGHRQLGYAFPQAEARAVIAAERLEATRAECRALGMAEPLVRVLDVDDPASAFNAIDAWSASPEPITAIAAHNDESAMLLDSAYAERGIRSGEDIALIGVDNVPSARIALTTVAINLEKFGDAIVARVRALLEDRELPPIDREDMVYLIKRHTA
ncbi:MAG: LacI family DNA-binding transcriptional regulator [Beutenbergiaceae bacterium]